MINSDFWRNKRVLITGHTGFKGSWLSIWLKNMDAKIYGISLPPEDSQSLFYLSKLENCISSNEFIDISNFNNLKNAVKKIKPEIVFHLAAQPLVRESYKKPLETWITNVQGSLNLLEALKQNTIKCSVIMITTDKVYENMNWDFGYRENDRLGGHDPYSASKAATEIAIKSWRSSFCGSLPHQTKYLKISTARAGNVIGGGDWAEDRIIPDAIRSLKQKKAIEIRSPFSTRPWQHVIEPLSGYLILAEKLFTTESDPNINKTCSSNPFASAFNFGPHIDSNKSVLELTKEILKNWPGSYKIIDGCDNLHEARKLNLQIDKAQMKLNWSPKWSFESAIKITINWYKKVLNNPNLAQDLCLSDIAEYLK